MDEEIKVVVTASVDDADKKINKVSQAMDNLEKKNARSTNSSHKFQSALSALGNGAKNVGSKIQSFAKNIGNSFSNNVTKATKHASNFTSGLSKLTAAFGRIALYRLLRTAIKEITEAFSEGIKAVSRYSREIGGSFSKTMDDLTSQLALMKGSLGAMAAPLIEALAPAITVVTNAVITLSNALNQLFSMLAGKSTWTKATSAVAKYDDAVKGASASQNKLTAGIDELNIINENGGGGASTIPNYQFEEMKLDKSKFSFLDDALDKIKALKGSTKEWFDNLDTKPLKDALSGLKDSFGNLASTVMDYVKPAWEEIVLPIGEWIIEEAIPKSIDALSGAFEILDILLEDAKPVFRWVLDHFIKPLGELLGNLATDALDSLNDSIDNFVDRRKNDPLFGDIEGDVQFAIDQFFDFSACLEETEKQINDFKGKFSGFTKDISDKATELKTNLNNKIAEIKENVSTKWSEIKNTVSTKWEEIKSDTELKWSLMKLSISTASERIRADLYSKWDEVKKNAGEKWDAIKTTFISTFDAMKEGIKSPVNAIISFVEKMVNGVVKGINKVIDGVNKIASIDIGDNSYGIHISRLNELSIPRLEHGGVMESGQLYTVRENGIPEFVGKYGNQGAVANNDMIVDGISTGVYEANMEIAGLLGTLIDVVRNKNMNVVVGDKAIGQANDRYLANRGTQVNSGYFANAY